MCTVGTLWFRLCLLPWGFVATTEALQATPPVICISSPQSNIGCEFYAVTLPNAFLDQTTFPFGIDLLNTAGSTAVDVTVTGGALTSADVVHIAAGSSVTATLPWVPSLSMSTATTIVTGGAYHLTSTGAVSALQLNSVDVQSAGTFSYSNDASLLIPVQSAGTAYRAVVWPTWNASGGQYPGDIAVVATTAATTVQVVASGTIQPGAGLNANGGSVVLDQGDVLLISSALDATLNGYGSDLSGALITSSAPVLVWTGHVGTFIPAATSYADHLEEILPPISALGSDYFVVRPGNPSDSPTGAQHYVKVVGTADGTTLTTNPPIAGAPAGLQAGQSATFEATIDFHLQSNNPVVVGLFMEGADTAGFNGLGDPAQSIAIPTSQGKRSIDFLAPSQFAPICAQLVAPTGATISIDATTVSGWTAIGTSGFSVTRFAVCGCTEMHHAVGNQPFTLSVHAYPQYTSYWYPGSLGIDDDIFKDGFE